MNSLPQNHSTNFLSQHSAAFIITFHARFPKSFGTKLLPSQNKACPSILTSYLKMNSSSSKSSKSSPSSKKSSPSQTPKASLTVTNTYASPSSSVSVAIIGGGISGLVCAHHLHHHHKNSNIQATVFDTGKRSVGGRASSRSIKQQNSKDSQHEDVFDHAAQFCTFGNDPRLQPLLNDLIKQQVLREWHINQDSSRQTLVIVDATTGNMYPWNPGNNQNATQKSPLYVGNPNMNSICNCLAAQVPVRKDTWVAHLAKKWSLDRNGKKKIQWELFTTSRSSLGVFDAVVIAHNGKCADRLTIKSKLDTINKFLLTSFGPKVRFDRQTGEPMQSLHLCSLFVLMAAFNTDVNTNFDAVMIYNDSTISWACNNTAKLGRKARQCWTFTSTREFAAKNKCPQEAIPDDVREKVKNEMLRAFEKISGLKPNSLKPDYYRIQLWGAAVPMNILMRHAPTNQSLIPTEFLYDAKENVGVCGDWLVSPSIEGAMISGIAMANWLHKVFVDNERKNYGFNSKFVPIKTNPLGAFPGLENESDE